MSEHTVVINQETYEALEAIRQIADDPDALVRLKPIDRQLFEYFLSMTGDDRTVAGMELLQALDRQAAEGSTARKRRRTSKFGVRRVVRRVVGRNKLMTVSEAARYMKCSVSTVHRLVRSGSIPHIRSGRAVCVRRSDIDAWIARRRKRIETGTTRER